MKRHALATVIILGGLFPYTAQATPLLGKYDAKTWGEYLDEKITSYTVHLYQVSRGKFPPVDLKTSVRLLSSHENAFRIGKSIFYRSLDGIRETPIGKTNSTLLISDKQRGLNVAAAKDPWLLISPSNAGNNVFLYNVRTKQQKKLSKSIRFYSDSAMGVFSDDGLHFAFTGWTEQSNMNLIVGETRTGRVSSFALPSSTFKCRTLSASPSFSAFQVGCQFLVEGKRAEQYGMFLIPTRDGKLVAQDPWVANVELHDSRWLDENHVVTTEYNRDEPDDGHAYVLTIESGEVVRKQKIFSFDPMNGTIDLDGVQVHRAALALQRLSSNRVLMYTWYSGVDPYTLGMLVYEYNRKTKKVTKRYQASGFWTLPEEYQR